MYFQNTVVLQFTLSEIDFVTMSFLCRGISSRITKTRVPALTKNRSSKSMSSGFNSALAQVYIT